ncbi:MAG: archaemetzincin family Zn-dependent metalloprotease [Planctomycetes bacterium]|nr:archaemetzincin family Zn-dependent metalloprotease [Planctomycetota bacterium]
MFKKMKPISIRPVGDVKQAVVSCLLEKLPFVFNRQVSLLEPMRIPAESFSGYRGQYLSAGILKELLRGAPDSRSKMLGITEVDIFVPIFTYVFGYAQLNGTAAVISTFRLNPENSGNERDNGLLCRRILKEAVHELGHTFGLVHCTEPGCVMVFANNILEVDEKGYEFCPSCMETFLTSD